jgi:hypothetical protein
MDIPTQKSSMQGRLLGGLYFLASIVWGCAGIAVAINPLGTLPQGLMTALAVVFVCNGIVFLVLGIASLVRKKHTGDVFKLGI